MAGITVFTNAFLIDCTGKEPIDGARRRGGTASASWTSSASGPGGAAAPGPGRDARPRGGRTLMPGLTDAPRPTSTPADGNTRGAAPANIPPSLLVAKGRFRRMEQALMQGFTTVRGCRRRGLRSPRGGGEPGSTRGRRMLVSGRVLSQNGAGMATSGAARSGTRAPSSAASAMVGVIADGPGRGPPGRRREQLRHDVDQIKVMASGGRHVTRPTSSTPPPVHTVEEMRAGGGGKRAAVGTYVLAHALPRPSAVRNALQAGVRCIEHGNLIDERVGPRQS